VTIEHHLHHQAHNSEERYQTRPTNDMQQMIPTLKHFANFRPIHAHIAMDDVEATDEGNIWDTKQSLNLLVTWDVRLRFDD
jgi:hypothetical protein